MCVCVCVCARAWIGGLAGGWLVGDCGDGGGDGGGGGGGESKENSENSVFANNSWNRSWCDFTP